MSNPEQYVELDPELPFTLLDQKEVLLILCLSLCCIAGNMLLLLTLLSL